MNFKHQFGVFFLIFVVRFVVVSYKVLDFRGYSNVTRIVHQFLHGVLNEFVKRIQLLSDQTLFFKVSTVQKS